MVDLWVNKGEVGVPLHHGHGRGKEGVALNDGLNDLRILVTVHDLIVVLGLHASANAAVNAVRDRVNQSRCVPQAWLKDGGNVADASQTLEGDHGAEEAVVALGVLQLHLVLEEVPRREDRVRKAAASLQAKAKLWALLLLHSPAAGQETLAARVEPHVVVEGFHAVLVGHAGRAPDGDAAEGGTREARAFHLGLPRRGVLRSALVEHLLLHLEFLLWESKRRSAR